CRSSASWQRRRSTESSFVRTTIAGEGRSARSPVAYTRRCWPEGWTRVESRSSSMRWRRRARPWTPATRMSWWCSSSTSRRRFGKCSRIVEAAMPEWSDGNRVQAHVQRGGVLSRDEIIARIRDPQRPLLRDYVSLDAQVQPNGIDLTLARVQRFAGPGRIATSNEGRVLPELEPLEPDEEGWFHLTPGAWHITYNEIVALPDDLMALGRPRSGRK